MATKNNKPKLEFQYVVNDIDGEYLVFSNLEELNSYLSDQFDYENNDPSDFDVFEILDMKKLKVEYKKILSLE